MSLIPELPDDKNSSSLQAALRYAGEFGWYVGPLYEITDDRQCACNRPDCGNSRGKHPIGALCPNGVKNFTNDLTTLRRWFTVRPDAGIGIDLARSQLVLIGPDSQEWLAEFQRRGLPEGAAVAESGGGSGHVHYYYARPVDAPESRVNRSGRYDVMSAGIGVLPPSMHFSGRQRRWLKPPREDLAPAPPWAVDMLAGEVPRLAETALAEPSGELQPPVKLQPDDYLLWSGNVVIFKNPTFEQTGPRTYRFNFGPVDRSETLFAVACGLARGNATERLLADELARIDRERGYNKFSERPKRYIIEARKALATAGERVESTQTLGVDVQDRIGSESQAPLLPFLTAKELGALTEPEPDWIVTGLLARGVTTELSAWIKAGKTTFAMYMIKAALASAPFLGAKTKPPKAVLYLSEEGRTTLRAALARAGLIEEERLYVLSRRELRHLNLTWAELISATIKFAEAVGADVLVVDTLSRLAGLTGSDENESGTAGGVMDALDDAAAAGLAVLLLRHDRKGGGEVGESARGSSAFGGAADILLHLVRHVKNLGSKRRRLEIVGRLDDASELVIELTDMGYLLVGDAEAVELEDAKRTLIGILPGPDEEPMVREQIGELSDLPKALLEKALAAVAKEGTVERLEGYGKTKRAYAWRRTLETE